MPSQQQLEFLPSVIPTLQRRNTSRQAKAPILKGGCGVCPLSCRLQFRVQGNGDPHSKYWFVGEAPGATEAEKKVPFVGKAGQLLFNDALSVAGIPRSAVYVSNVVQCWPEGNRTPTKKERDACKIYIEEEIAKYKPTSILAIGESAFLALVNSRAAISEARGREWVRSDGVKVLPTFHTAYLLRKNLKDLNQLFHIDLKRYILSVTSSDPVDFYTAAGFKYKLLDRKGLIFYLNQAATKKSWMAIDIETDGEGKPYMVSMSTDGIFGAVVYYKDVPDLIRQLVKTKNLYKVFQDGGSFDIPKLEKATSEYLENYAWDTFVAGITIDSRKGKNSLPHLAEWATPLLSGYKHRLNQYRMLHSDCQKDYSKIPEEILVPYSAYDAIATALVFKKQWSLANHPLVYFYRDLVREVLTPMEEEGVLVDEEYLDRMLVHLDKEIDTVLSKVRTIAGDKDFNPGSPDQLSNLLFNRLKLPVNGIRRSEKKNKVTYCVDKQTLAKFSSSHPIANLVSVFRRMEKDRTTYGERIKKNLDANKRFHIKYWIGGGEEGDSERGAETGRLSSPLQNIPRVDKSKNKVFEPANMFIPPKGKIWLLPDYSQAELRVAAVFSKDQQMIRDFRDGIDAHASVCYSYLGVQQGQEISSEVRVKAKNINFAKIFGSTAIGLAIQLRCAVDYAQKLLEADSRKYPGYWTWREEQVRSAADLGYVETLFGFRRPLSIPDWERSVYNKFELFHWQRQALNTPIQGTASHLLCLAMLIFKRRNVVGARMSMNIHDSAPTEVAVGKVDSIMKEVKFVMEEAIVEETWKLFKKDISIVPWVADFKIGERLGEMRPYYK